MPDNLRIPPLGASDPSALPYATEAIPLSGEIRARPEDFRVEEIPAYEPAGNGDHLFVFFEKTDLGTPEAIRRLARALGSDPAQAGYAGLKDRRAVTRQWASFLRADADRLHHAEDGTIRVLRAERHPHKLRTGHLRGNRFDILVRGAPSDRVADLRRQLDELARRGVPNYFGPQRFGRDGQNLEDAARWLLLGGHPPKQRFRRKLLVSTLQSAVFNELLAERVKRGQLDSLVDGDLVQKLDTGGLFVSSETAADQERAARFELSATGPMFGAKMRWPEREARRLEEAALARWGIDEATMSSFRKAGPGTRRAYRVPLSNPAVEGTPEGIRLSFGLPSGAYATVVLREILRRPVE